MISIIERILFSMENENRWLDGYEIETIYRNYYYFFYHKRKFISNLKQQPHINKYILKHFPFKLIYFYNTIFKFKFIQKSQIKTHIMVLEDTKFVRCNG